MKRKHYQLSRIGKCLALRAAIGGKDDFPPLPITLIVDTGAAYTVIYPEILRATGYDLEHPLQEVPLLTVDRMIRAPVITVSWLHCLGQRVSPWSVLAYPLPRGFRKYEVDGLLGMDFLTHFGAVIHTGRGEIWLEEL